LRRADASGLLKNAERASAKFSVGAGDVDHQVVVDAIEADHGCGGEHVEDQFLRSAGLHARGAGENFGASVGRDGHASELRERRVTIGSERGSESAAMVRFFHGSQDERRGADGGDAEDHVIFIYAAVANFASASGYGIFGAFDGFPHGVRAAGHDGLNAVAAHAEGRRDFGSVKSAHAAAGTGADIDQAAAFFQRFHDLIHHANNLRDDPRDGARHPGVFAIDDAKNGEGGFLVETRGTRVAPFGDGQGGDRRADAFCHLGIIRGREKEGTGRKGGLCLKFLELRIARAPRGYFGRRRYRHW
jgi:hypothetical protein